MVVAFVGLGGAGIAAWEYSNSDAFCAGACHEVHPEETYAHRMSQHSEVACVECHMGRLSTFEAMAKKVTHTGELWAMLVGYERPLTASMPASRESCEGCHSKAPHQNDTIRQRTHFEPDRQNTETQVRVVLRTGRTSEDAPRMGIHWHVDNVVRFIATDPQRLEIPWVEVTRPDRTTVVYRDSERPLEPEQVAAAERLTMGCIDCHNRSGHPFRDPEAEVDLALSEGKLNRDLPYLKARATELFDKTFASEEEALQHVKEAVERYRKDYPDIPQAYPEAWAETQRYLEERERFMAGLMVRSRFLEPGLSWRSFPDHSGHQSSPGCFRCHSGRHLDDQANPIPVSCTLCHSIPIVTREGATTPHVLSAFGLNPLPNHYSPHFVKAHGSLVDASCQACHGEIRYGTDNKSFCSNPACHGQKSPYLTLK
jgi:hypothetical protein